MKEDMISCVRNALVAEFARQSPGVYYFDRRDAALLAGGKGVFNDFQKPEGGTVIYQLGDSFDMDAVAVAALRAVASMRKYLADIEATEKELAAAVFPEKLEPEE